MKKVFGITMAVTLLFSAIAFAGPFVGGSLDAGRIDLSVGANFEKFSVTGTFYDIDVRSAAAIAVPGADPFDYPYAGLSLTTNYEKGNMDVDFGLEFLFNTLGYPIIFTPTGLTFNVDATFDLAVLFDTDWTVDAFVGADYALVSYATSKVVLSAGFYIEAPWSVQTGSSAL